MSERTIVSVESQHLADVSRDRKAIGASQLFLVKMIHARNTRELCSISQQLARILPHFLSHTSARTRIAMSFQTIFRSLVGKRILRSAFSNCCTSDFILPKAKYFNRHIDTLNSFFLTFAHLFLLEFYILLVIDLTFISMKVISI